MKNKVVFTFLSLLFLGITLGGTICLPLDVFAQQDWKQEYADVCAKTQNAMGLTVEELQGYIERCDKLQEQIDKLNGSEGKTERKVYEKRLKMCRDLYNFALEYKGHQE